jgi:WhiB family transcriptional regulator, redox-sensing transcriptional regulator
MTVVRVPRLEWSEGAAGPVLGHEPAPLDERAVRRIFAAAATELSWQDRALCPQTDPEAFFPEKGGSTREAKKVCRACDVRAECLEYALEHGEWFGIWGGLSEQERRRLKRETGPSPAPRGADVARYRELAANGLEVAAIAERMGVTKERVWKLAASARRQEKREANAA